MSSHRHKASNVAAGNRSEDSFAPAVPRGYGPLVVPQISTAALKTNRHGIDRPPPHHARRRR